MSQLKVHIETIEIHDQQEFEGREGHAGRDLVRKICETENEKSYFLWLAHHCSGCPLVSSKGQCCFRNEVRGGPKRIGRTNTPLQQEECPEIELCC